MSDCRYLAILQYDGTSFHGWQRQAADRTVQGEFEDALFHLFQRRTVVHAAGRTDAGVHALGQVTSFPVPSGWSPEALRRALNGRLPRDIWVRESREVSKDFHARRSATARVYRYVIGTDEEARSPFRRPFEWALARPLDMTALWDGARAFLGEHQFGAFAARGTPHAHYRCTVHRAQWRARKDNAGVTFEIEANRFLHHMVRFLVGTMVDVAGGRRPATDLARLLGREDTQDTSPPAPPQGLYLEAVRYPDHSTG